MSTIAKSKVRLTARRVRASIRHAALTRMPLRLSGGRLARRPSVQGFRVVERTVSLPCLPPELDGLRITHLSDLHVGDLLPPSRLPAIVAAVNDLGGDMIAATGDFIDYSLGVLDDVVEAVGRLSAPLGVYLVPGNHDHLLDGPQVIRRFQDAGLSMLINQRQQVRHRGRKVTVAGIDYTHRRRHVPGLLHSTFVDARHRRDDDLRLLLAHHPHDFDHARPHGVDLTLSGHTHGGQIVLSRTNGRRGSVGLGSLAFRYPHGLYRHGDQFLHVTSGLGSWFPLRMQCPAEVVCLTLRRSA